MLFGKCKKCGAEFNKTYAEYTAKQYGGVCFECAMQSPETNPYGHQNYTPVEDRRAKFNRSKNRG